MQPCFNIGPVSFLGWHIGPVLYTIFQSWADYVLLIYAMSPIEVFFILKPNMVPKLDVQLGPEIKIKFCSKHDFHWSSTFLFLF